MVLVLVLNKVHVMLAYGFEDVLKVSDFYINVSEANVKPSMNNVADVSPYI